MRNRVAHSALAGNYYRKLIIETASFLWNMFESHGRRRLYCVATANQIGAS